MESQAGGYRSLRKSTTASELSAPDELRQAVRGDAVTERVHDGLATLATATPGQIDRLKGRVVRHRSVAQGYAPCPCDPRSNRLPGNDVRGHQESSNLVRRESVVCAGRCRDQKCCAD